MYTNLKSIHPSLSASPLVRELPEYERLRTPLERRHGREVTSFFRRDRSGSVRGSSAARKAGVKADPHLCNTRLRQQMDIDEYENFMKLQIIEFGLEEHERWESVRTEVEGKRSLVKERYDRKMQLRRAKERAWQDILLEATRQLEGMTRTELRARTKNEREERRAKNELLRMMRISAMAALHSFQRRVHWEAEWEARCSLEHEDMQELEGLPRRHEQRVEQTDRGHIMSIEKSQRIHLLKVVQMKADWKSKWDSLFQTLNASEVMHSQKLQDEEGLEWLSILDVRTTAIADEQRKKRMEAERISQQKKEWETMMITQRRDLESEHRTISQATRSDEALMRSHCRDLFMASYNDVNIRIRTRIERERAEYLAHCVAEQTPHLLKEKEMRCELIAEESGAWVALMALFTQIREDLWNPIQLTMTSTCCPHSLNSFPVSLFPSLKIQRKAFTRQHTQLVANCCLIVSIFEPTSIPEDILEINCVEVASLKEKVKSQTGLRLMSDLLYDDEGNLLGAVQKANAQHLTIKCCGPEEGLFRSLEKLARAVTFRTESFCMLPRKINVKVCANFVQDPLTPRTKKVKQLAYYKAQLLPCHFTFENMMKIELSCIPPILYLPPEKCFVNFDARRKVQGKEGVLFVLVADGLKIDSTSCRDYRNGSIRLKIAEGYINEDILSFMSNESLYLSKGEFWRDVALIARVTHGRIWTGTGRAEKSREAIIQFEDCPITPALIECLLSRFQFTTTNFQAEPKRRVIEIILQEGPQPQRLSHIAAVSLEIFVVAAGDILVDITLSDEKEGGTVFYRVSSTNVPPTLAEVVQQPMCRVMQHAVVSSLSLLKFGGAVCKISIISGLNLATDSLTLVPHTSALRMHFSKDSGTTLRYVSGSTSYVLGTMSTQKGGLLISFVEAEVAALQAILRSVVYVPTDMIPFSCLKIILVELTLPDPAKKKKWLFKSQIGLFVARPSIHVPYSKSFVDLESTTSLQRFDSFAMSTDESDFLHFDGGLMRVKLRNATDSDVLDVIEAPRIPNIPGAKGIEEDDEKGAGRPLIPVVRPISLPPSASRKSSMSPISEDGVLKALAQPPVEMSLFEELNLWVMDVPSCADMKQIVYTKSLDDPLTVLATFRPGPVIDFEFAGKRAPIIPLRSAAYSVGHRHLMAVLQQIAYRQINAEGGRKVLSVSVEDKYGGKSHCVCELNLSSGSKATQILLSTSHVIYRHNDPALVHGVLRVMPDAVLGDERTAQAMNGSLIIEPRTELTSADVLTILSTEITRVDEAENRIFIDDELVGTYRTADPTRSFIVDFTPGLSLESCAAVLRGVGYRNLPLNEYPEIVRELVFLVRFNAGNDGVQDSHIQLFIHVQKPVLSIMPMYRSVLFNDDNVKVFANVQIRIPNETSLSGGYLEARIVEGFCPEDRVVFSFPQGFRLSAVTSMLEVDIALGRQIMEHIVLPTLGYQGLLVGQVIHSQQFCRLAFHKMSPLNAKFLSTLLECVKYQNENKPPRVHTRKVQVALHVPECDNALSSLVTEVEIAGSNDMTVITLQSESRTYIVQEPPLQLFRGASVEDSDTPFFSGPHAYLIVEITSCATPDDALILLPYGCVEFCTATKQVMLNGAQVVATLQPTSNHKKLHFKFNECPLQVIEDLLGMVYFETHHSVDKGPLSASLLIECNGAAISAATKVRFEVLVFPALLTGFSSQNIYETTLDDVTHQSELFPPHAQMTLETMDNAEVTFDLWTMAMEIPGQSGVYSRARIPAYDRLILAQLPSELEFKKRDHHVIDKASSTRICTVRQGSDTSITLTFLKTMRTLNAAVYMSILRAVVFECKQLHGAESDYSGMVTPRGSILGMSNPNSSFCRGSLRPGDLSTSQKSRLGSIMPGNIDGRSSRSGQSDFGSISLPPSAELGLSKSPRRSIFPGAKVIEEDEDKGARRPMSPRARLKTLPPNAGQPLSPRARLNTLPLSAELGLSKVLPLSPRRSTRVIVPKDDDQEYGTVVIEIHLRAPLEGQNVIEYKVHSLVNVRSMF